jgi:hypothetical protein
MACVALLKPAISEGVSSDITVVSIEKRRVAMMRRSDSPIRVMFTLTRSVMELSGLSEACGGEVGASLFAGGLALAQGAVNFVVGYTTREAAGAKPKTAANG